MQRRFPGSQVDLVVLNAAPGPGDAGTDLNQFIAGGGKPDEYDIRLDISGGGTADFILYVRDGVGWSRACDAGNLGQLAAQTLTANDVFATRVDGLAGYKEVCLFKSVVGGAVNVNAAKITPILRAVEG